MPEDGPVSSGHCTACGGYFADDIYRYMGVILCGDCRYYVRHGRVPNHEPHPGAGSPTSGVISAQESRYHGSGYSP